MTYGMEELLPIVTRLTDKYTSKESSSVPYETARMLMTAVIYCVEECLNYTGNSLMAAAQEMPAEIAYKKGCEYVIEKVYESKEIFEKILAEFDDYGCKNYHDTILIGMPTFFVQYDAKFNPQDHILTLDYRPLGKIEDLRGVDCIHQYLSDIAVELKFLSLFGREVIERLLERIQPDYQTLYFDNICYSVLFFAIGCVVADKPVFELDMDGADCKEVTSYFAGDDLAQAEKKVNNILHLIMMRLTDGEALNYFSNWNHDYAVRIINALQTNSLEVLFGCHYE